MQPAPPSESNVRLMKVMKAPPEQLALIDRVLAGEKPFPHHHSTDGPLVMRFAAAAKYLGVHRGTIAKMVMEGRLKAIEVVSGCYRIRRRDIERFVAGYGKEKT